MEEKFPVGWASVANYLEAAALLPQRRPEMISCALQEMLTSIPAVSAALIWPCHQNKTPWKVYYAGSKRNTMLRWLSARLDPSLDTMMGVLEYDLTHQLSDMPTPLLTTLRAASSSSGGLWILWVPPPSPSSPPVVVHKWLEPVRQTLEAVLEVLEKERLYFSRSSPLYDRELVEALVHDDHHAMSAFLSLTRVVAKADLAFWARVNDNVVEVSGHLGAKDNNFGFSLPRGHGLGGRVIAYGKPMEVTDYRNSPYRDEPRVSAIVDSEQIRSGMALPVRYYTAPDTGTPVTAVLYATRRTVAPFTQAERLLAQSQAFLLGRLTLETRTPSFFVSNPKKQYLPDHKTVWHNLVLHGNRIEEVEAWASQLIKGAVIVTNSDGNPYVWAHSEQLESIRASADDPREAVYELSLTAPGVHEPGHVYLCPSIPLPPPQWPDFDTDLVVACNSVIVRMERRQDQLDHQREEWLHALLQKKLSPYLEQDGYRLGLPVGQGQLWVLAWQQGSIQATKSVRKRIIAESILLEYLKSSLMFFDDDTAVVLFDEQTQQKLSTVRDALLKHCGAYSLWIVSGGRYHSLANLKTTLDQAILIAQKARRERHEDYLLDIYTFGLDSLLENPVLVKDLDAFAKKLLTPLIEYDRANSAHLTETFVLAQTLGSAQSVAEQLGVHVNTIRYRLHRAEELLGTDQTCPKEHAAMILAAFTWQRFHQASF
jgi:sugar diacid utilization regulator